jgi:Na+(H+)/acetate symporter ActP
LLRLHVNAFDYLILAIYFGLVVTIGVMARRAVATSEDFLLSGRSLPAWVAGLAVPGRRRQLAGRRRTGGARPIPACSSVR